MSDINGPLINKTFDSFINLEEFINNYEIQVKKKLIRKNAHKLKDEGDPLKYHSFKYFCICAGKPLGKNQEKSKKCDCPFFIKIGLTDDKKKLIIKEHIDVHNEECDKRSLKFFKTDIGDTITTTDRKLPKANKEKSEPLNEYFPEPFGNTKESTKSVIPGVNKEVTEPLDQYFEEPFNTNTKEPAVEESIAKNPIKVSDKKWAYLMENVKEDSLVDMFENSVICDGNEKNDNAEPSSKDEANEVVINAFPEEESTSSSTHSSKFHADGLPVKLEQDEHYTLQHDNTASGIIFEEVPIKSTRGRPKGSKKIKPIGIKIKPENLAFRDKETFQKKKVLLKILIGNEVVSNILESSYVINLNDLKEFNENTLDDLFYDKDVKINIIKKYCTQEAFKYLADIVKKKRSKNYLKCDVCSLQADLGTVQCDSCLHWYHFKCLSIDLKSLENNYFCPACI